MEAYDNDQMQDSTNINAALEKGISWLYSFLGIIIVIICTVLAFLLASLDGTKEIRASNSLSGKLLNEWREEVGDLEGILFPQEKVDIIEYKDKEYYFLIEETDEEGNITKWYYAYDSNFSYVFQDERYYILWALVFILALTVAVINYKQTVNNQKEGRKFKSTLIYYQEQKKNSENITQHLPNFCNFKNKQAYENKKREIIENADIDYDYYNSVRFNYDKLEDWQKKRLKKIKKIKIKRLTQSDLLQEHNGKVGRKVVLLPISEEEHFKGFVVKKVITNIFSLGVGGLVIGFGFKFGNIGLGLTFGSMVISSWISAVFTAIDFVNNTLRNRFIAKGNYLKEFYNTKDKYINVKEENPKSVVIETEQPIINEIKDKSLTESVENINDINLFKEREVLKDKYGY